jgi:hypothetical protein
MNVKVERTTWIRLRSILIESSTTYLQNCPPLYLLEQSGSELFRAMLRFTRRITSPASKFGGNLDRDDQQALNRRPKAGVDLSEK